MSVLTKVAIFNVLLHYNIYFIYSLTSPAPCKKDKCSSSLLNSYILHNP